MKFFNGILETPDEAIDRLDDIGGPHSHTNYPWGWAQCGNTPVQVVQAEHPRRRRARAAGRPLHRGFVAAGQAGTRRGQFVNVADIVADDLRADRRHTARDLSRRRATSGHRALVRVDAGRRRRARHEHAAVLRDGRQPRPRRRRVEGRVQARRGRRLRHRAVGALPPRRPTGPSATDLAAAQPDKLAELVELWWQEADRHGVLPDRRADDRALRRPLPAPLPSPDRSALRLPAPDVTAARPGGGRDRGPQLRPHRAGHPRPRETTGCSSRPAPRTPASRCSCRTIVSWSTTTPSTTTPWSSPTSRCPPATSTLAAATSDAARAGRARSRSRSTASRRATPICRCSCG